MSTQSINIMQETWDYLILLDACRYDVFERTYRDFLDPVELRGIDSVGTSTSEWRKKTFVESYPDTVYVSANPYIASEESFDGFRGGAHFFKVVDVWKTGWDHERGTVLPATVTQQALYAMVTYSSKRLIIHYLQPHAPYLVLEDRFQGFPAPDPSSRSPISGLSRVNVEHPWQSKLFCRLLPWAKRSRCFGDPPEWRLRQWLGMPPASPMDAARRALGRKGLRRAYEENLRRVLAEVARLLPHLEGTVVITSDHGERLGEGGRYTHTPNSDDPLLRRVPWLVLHRRRQQPPPSYELLDAQQPSPCNTEEPDERTCIEDRLRALGYME